MSIRIDSPVSELHGVGPAMQKRLGYLGIRTISDLIWHLPRSHDDQSSLTDVIDMSDGATVTARVQVEKMTTRKAYRRRRMSITEAQVGDDTGSIKVIWFNQPYIQNSIAVGDELFLSGKVKKTKYGLSIQAPIYEKLSASEGGDQETTHTARIVPLYSLTAGITQKQIRYFIKQALDGLPVESALPDILPAAEQEELGLPALGESVRQVHFPDDAALLKTAWHRIHFDELLLVQLMILQERSRIDTQQAEPIPFNEAAVKTFVSSLPFQLTGAQRKSAWDALRDMERTRPMHRLVVGDVGSGKTVVAAIALLNTVAAGKQGILMAPTEILAKQHAASLQHLFRDMHISVELLTGSYKGATDADVIVGTHALIQESVEYRDLGLAVVDEQHRFGVQQRRLLKERSGNAETIPHLLSLTATPIPRTLALALYGDLDLSIIDEMPAGRLPVKTHLVPDAKRADGYDFIREHIAKGEQCFVICPLIDESDKLGVRSVTQEFERLSKEVFPDLRVAQLHGKMKPEEKDALMKQMRDKEIDILVATSVIEVGVDIPDATIMIIEGAERFGLAQLHQFRGRVGRSDTQSYCFLFSGSDSERTRERLNALTTINDGFRLAEVDLELRGPGEVFGSAQSGVSAAAVLALQQPALLDAARSSAQRLITSGAVEQHAPLVERFQLFLRSVHLE